MFANAPIREIGIRLVVIHYLAARYASALKPDLGRALQIYNALGPPGPGDPPATHKFEETKESLVKDMLKTVEESRALARRLHVLLAGKVAYPADEESKVVVIISEMRRCILHGEMPPSQQLVIDHCVRLWTLADALGEPSITEPRGKRRKPKKQLSQEDVAHGLLAVHAGSHTSTRKLATLLHVSQSTISRNAILREALRGGGKLPRRGFRTRTRGDAADLEVVDESESDEE
jgi:hypothetical protein